MLPLKGVVRFLKHEERALSRKRLVGDFQICLRCIGWEGFVRGWEDSLLDEDPRSGESVHELANPSVAA